MLPAPSPVLRLVPLQVPGISGIKRASSKVRIQSWLLSDRTSSMGLGKQFALKNMNQLARIERSNNMETQRKLCANKIQVLKALSRGLWLSPPTAVKWYGLVLEDICHLPRAACQLTVWGGLPVMGNSLWTLATGPRSRHCPQCSVSGLCTAGIITKTGKSGGWTPILHSNVPVAAGIKFFASMGLLVLAVHGLWGAT